MAPGEVALTRRAAAAETSAEMVDSCIASIVSGTCRPTRSVTLRWMAANDRTATAEAMTVMSATMPNAACSLALMLNLPARRRLADGLGDFDEAPSVMRWFGSSFDGISESRISQNASPLQRRGMIGAPAA